jgi:PGF-CTERM protein
MLATSITGSSAFGDIYKCESQISIDYDKNLAYQPLLPVNMTLDIPIKVNYYVTGLYGEYIAPVYFDKGLFNYIYLYIEKTPEWCDATITPPLLMMPAITDGAFENATLTIKINREAHAFDQGEVTIRFHVDRMGAIQGADIFKNITFTPGYLPMLGINVPDGIVKSINPAETANFNIEIENLGNAKTNVTFRLLGVPKGWTASITPKIILGSEALREETKKTVSLNIKPPYGFGYHNDREIIKVSITPSHFDDTSLRGSEYKISFTVKNKGFSTPGFEAVFSLFALVAVVLVIRKKQKLNQKRTKKNSRKVDCK